MRNEEISPRRKFSDVWPLLDERSRRLIAASEALCLGYGGISRIRRAVGIPQLQEIHRATHPAKLEREKREIGEALEAEEDAKDL